MSNINPILGQSVRSLQTFLRQIAYIYQDIPLVIPDGIYGVQTEAAVKAFQNKFDLSITGIVDLETWNLIVDTYQCIMEFQVTPSCINIFPSAQRVFFPGDSSPHLIPIQAIMLTISNEFPNLSTLAVNGNHTGNSILITQDLQKVFGMDPTGIIEKRFWERLVNLYQSHILRHHK